MYPSNSNYNICNDLISYSDQAFLQLPNLNIISNSKQEDPSSLCFLGHFSSSPSIDGNAFLENHHDGLLFHQQSMVKSDKNTTGTVTNMVDSRKTHINRQTVAEQIPRKRTYKGDRHSKINTARGPRDRRMRLSLEVARKFFGLQDMLGFDKASKTVEWLLLQAKIEIKKLAREVKRSCSVGVRTSTTSSTSECGEVLSGIDEVAIYDGNRQAGRAVSKEKPSTCTAGKEKKNIRQWRKSAFHPLARESRDQARARARERTKEKLRTRRLDESKLCEVDTANSCDLSRLRLWSLLETGELESAGTQSHNMMNPSMDQVLPEIEEESSHAPDYDLGAAEDMVNHDDSLVIIGRWSPSLIFNTVNINTGISQEHHEFTDSQFFGKPCEACNNNNQYDKDYLSYNVWR